MSEVTSGLVETGREVRGSTLLARLRAAEPTITVELRPPRSGLSYAAGMDAWIDMYHTLERLARDDRYIFLTDNAVDAAEEESLGHVAANLARGVPASRIVPFLTAKHSLDYCMMFARRAVSSGCEALAVVGGDTTGPPPRCVEHGYQLRDLIRCEFPSLTLGGWANPHADPAVQVDYIARGDFEADFFLTQIVSHHSLPTVERFLEELDRRGVDIPATFGVFFYRSANPATLRRLSRFLPIPAEQITREFDAGASAAEICARSIRALQGAGVRNIYLANLGFRSVDRRYRAIMRALEGMGG